MPVPLHAHVDEVRWQAECAGKEAYPSEAAACADLARIKAGGRGMRICWLEPYRCRSCKEWHLGNINGANKKNLKGRRP